MVRPIRHNDNGTTFRGLQLQHQDVGVEAPFQNNQINSSRPGSDLGMCKSNLN